MSGPFDATPVAIRDDARVALNRGLAELGGPGEWLDGPERLAIARAARQAWDCTLCKARKEALSPNAVEGRHDHQGDLPDAWVEVVHRVVTDSGRLTEAWLKAALAAGIAEDEFVEMVSVTIIATVIDAFAFGIGMAAPELPDPQAGTPARQRRKDAKPGPGWVATIAPEDAAPDFVDFYDNETYFYIRRSLTLVPGEVRRFWELMNPLYMEDPRLHELDGMERGINRAQMEFLAARASMLLGCFY